jgi:hypothetical protein
MITSSYIFSLQKNSFKNVLSILPRHQLALDFVEEIYF